jgi:hypothetical protein
LSQWLVALIGRTAALPSTCAATASAAAEPKLAPLPETKAERSILALPIIVIPRE